MWNSTAPVRTFSVHSPKDPAAFLNIFNPDSAIFARFGSVWVKPRFCNLKNGGKIENLPQFLSEEYGVSKEKSQLIYDKQMNFSILLSSPLSE